MNDDILNGIIRTHLSLVAYDDHSEGLVIPRVQGMPTILGRSN